MNEQSLQADRYIGWIRGAIDGMNRSVREQGVDLSYVWEFRRSVLAAADELAANLVEAAPALHLIFDDHQSAASFTVTPAVNIKIGDEIHKLSWITQDDLKIPEIKRGLGRPLATLIECSFTMSHVLKEAGHEGMTFITEIDDDDIFMLAARYDERVQDEEPMPS
jgi:hypothetical protein